MAAPIVLERAIYPFLSSQPEITALVGTRIYPDVRPEGSPLPAVTWTEAGGNAVTSHQGMSGLALAVIQFSAWSLELREAAEIRAAIRRALLGYKGVIGLPPGVYIKVPEERGAGGGYEPETGIYHRWTRLAIWHRVARPGEE